MNWVKEELELVYVDYDQLTEQEQEVVTEALVQGGDAGDADAALDQYRHLVEKYGAEEGDRRFWWPDGQ